ncbi:hypothetical protein [Robiginitomaculum antarcticum]|uniref:hypothetical protein n=1 Tax=Robiginitomaculum antarcticum TaxID=437507 RepID=UPI00037ECAB1|nr:hypothetical protein [Robiginitomaculum antarcticum]
MDNYIKENTDMFRPLGDIYARARSGKGAKFLDIKTCQKFIIFLKSKKSAVTTAEHTAVSPDGTWLQSYLDFFWEQKCPENQTWAMFYDTLNSKFQTILDDAGKDVNIHYFQVWAGMKGDESEF